MYWAIRCWLGWHKWVGDESFGTLYGRKVIANAVCVACGKVEC